MKYRSDPLRHTAAISAFILFGVLANAQNVEWVRQFEAAEAHDVAANETGVYVVGSVSTAVPAERTGFRLDASVHKYDAAGSLVWVRSFGTPDSDVATAVAAEGATVAVAGQVAGELPGQTSAGSSDAFVRLYDVNGNELWTRQFGTSGPDWVQGVSVAAGSVYVVGVTSPPSGPSFLRKYDSSGNLIWSREIPLGLFGSVASVAAESTAIYVTGSMHGLPATAYDAFLRKYDLSGSELWTQQFDLPLGTPGAPSTQAGAVTVDASGIYIGGRFGPEGIPIGVASFPLGPRFPSAFVRKYDFDGNEQWTRPFRLTDRDNVAWTLTANSTGLYVGGGFTSLLPGDSSALGSYPFVRKYDESGTEQWTFVFGQPIGRISGLAANGASLHAVAQAAQPWPGKESLGHSDSVVLKMAAGTFPPVLSANPVVDSASLIPTRPLVAGSIASLFGLNLSPSPEVVAVDLNGIVAPLIAITPTQINFQVPWELAGLSEARLTVTTNGVGSASAIVRLSPVAPGLFSVSGTGQGQGAILVSNTATLAAPVRAFPDSRPALKGQVISIFCTGLGAVSDQPPTGVSASASPLSTTLSIPKVTIAGEIAPVQFSGLAPGLVGVYQVNVLVPAGRFGGSGLSVVVEMGGFTSNTVTIAVE
jgi:uncharacterized protein (TIGR03437 family)